MKNISKISNFQDAFRQSKNCWFRYQSLKEADVCSKNILDTPSVFFPKNTFNIA
jgi:hypothetical protein